MMFVRRVTINWNTNRESKIGWYRVVVLQCKTSDIHILPFLLQSHSNPCDMCNITL